MFRQAQSFRQFMLLNAYEVKKCVFEEHVKSISIPGVPMNAKVVSSHPVNKMKMNVVKISKVTKVIPLYRKENIVNILLKSTCTMRSHAKNSYVTAIASLLQCTIAKANAKAVLLD